MSQRLLINVKTIKDYISSGVKFESNAIPVSDGAGWKLQLSNGAEEYMISTWRTDKVKVYKTSDSLLKEAEQLGLMPVTFLSGEG